MARMWEREPLYTVGGNKNWCSHCGKQYGDLSKKQKVEPPCMLVAQSCPTLCYPMVCSPPGSSVHEFSRQEYWSGLPFPSPGELPDPGIEPRSPALQAGSLPSEPPGKPRTTIWPRNSIPGYISEKTTTTTVICEDTCTSMLIAALFTIAKIWKQHKCPSTGELIKKVEYIDIMKQYWAHKKVWNIAICSHTDGLEGHYAESEIYQTEKDKYCTKSFIMGI